MATRYGNNLKNTSDYVEELLSEYVKVPRTPFDNSCRIIFDTTPYAIVPFDVWEMLPNSDAYIDYDLQILSKIPTVKRLLSGMTAEVRTYKVNYNDCFEGWNNFITKGRSGKVTKSLPFLDWTLGSVGDYQINTNLPYNPYSYMGIAPACFIAKNLDADPARKFKFTANSAGQYPANTESSTLSGISTIDQLKASTAMRVNALPAVFYNKIAKQFIPSNLLQDNPHWYPENENHDMILPYNASGAVTTSDYDNPTKSITSIAGITSKWSSSWQPSVVKDSNDSDYVSYPWLNILHYADRKADYFTTGSPFPDLIRGDIPTIDVLRDNTDFSNAFPTYQEFQAINADSGKFGYNLFTIKGANLFKFMPGLDYQFTEEQYNTWKSNTLKVLNANTINSISISMSQWRYLATITVLRERLALTDGSYNELIKAMFGHNPRWHNHEPQYCGGFTQPLVFSEVVNTAESASAPLGDTAGRAVSAEQHSTIHVHSDDFGMFMSVLVIRPDEYYCQGVDKMWSRLENAEQYMPILNNLAPDATLNKELYVSGTNSTDEDVFNHQERFAYYKSRRNRIAGLLAMPSSVVSDVSAFVMKRLFGSTPNFNAEFTRGQMTTDEKSVFAGIDQAEFNVVIGSNFKYVGPIPRNTRPSDMGISY